MSLQARRELLFRIHSRYQDADKHQKTVIINGFVAATGYRRKYAIDLLNKGPKQLDIQQRTRKPKYGEDVRLALLSVWNTTNQICGKRLVCFMPVMVESLERFGHLKLTDETRTQLLSISAATIDRIVAQERAKSPKGRSTTKAGGLLKQRIKVRTFADWKECEPGFFEADLVAHCGERVDGAFLNTLVLTDIATAWTEFVPLLRRSYSDVKVSLEAIRQAMPMPLLGLDTDNGSEFINHELFEYCDSEKISFTRSRPYRKNDQAHVEQKNGNIVRRIVGYDRYEGEQAWDCMLRLYRVLRLYVNFFQPSMKLLTKSRDRSKITKHYDKAQTPFERVLKSSKIPTATKDRLQVLFKEMDPVALFREIRRCQNDLEKLEFADPVAEDSNESKSEPAEEPTKDVREELSSSLKWPRKKHIRTKHSKPRTWRTRPDPFASVESDIVLAIQVNPDLNAKQLFKQLQEEHPGMFKGNEVRTLRRRVAAVRDRLCDQAKLDLNLDTKYGENES